MATGRLVGESYVASRQLPLVGVTTTRDILLTERPVVTGLLSPEGRKEGRQAGLGIPAYQLKVFDNGGCCALGRGRASPVARSSHFPFPTTRGCKMGPGVLNTVLPSHLRPLLASQLSEDISSSHDQAQAAKGNWPGLTPNIT